MCKYVGIVVYEGIIEGVRTFDFAKEAEEWITQRRQDYGMEETSDSLIWDTGQQVPPETPAIDKTAELRISRRKGRIKARKRSVL